MAFVNIKDDTKQIKITYWPATFSKIKGLLTVGKIYKFEIDINDKGIIGSSIIEEINKIL
jgi:DNA polymerase III alpha subunit